MTVEYLPHQQRLPNSLVWLTVGLCVLPIALILSGVDFGAALPHIPWQAGAPLADDLRIDSVFVSMRAAFIHTVLEWTAFTTALFTAVLSFIYFTVRRDVATPVIGMALFCAGCMDAFHVLAADRLITALVDNNDLIPFAWAMSRLFNAVILIAGAGLFLIPAIRRRRGDMRIVLLLCVIFATIAYNVIAIIATSSALPETMFPDQFVKRPWDILPLLLYLAAAVFVFPRFYQVMPTVFSHALLLSVVPHIATQLHAAFGSTQLFDSHFNAAQFLKIVAYTVPLMGLAIDYINSQKRQDLGVQQLQELQESLEASNEDLRRFAVEAAQNLKEPLKQLSMANEQARKRLFDILGKEGKDLADRLQSATAQIQSIADQMVFIETDLTAVVRDVLAARAAEFEAINAQVRLYGLPAVTADPVQMRQLFEQLIDNAVKFRQVDVAPLVQIRGRLLEVDSDRGPEVIGQVIVEDNGVGFDHRDSERIFKMFERLHPTTEGTGMGLALCRTIVERHDGTIIANSQVGNGAKFIVEIPATHIQPGGDMG